jgi:galactokinase
MPSTAKGRALAVFRERFGREPALVICAPGRVNLIGEHVDYNAGLVLPAAIDRAAWIAAAPAAGDAVTIEACDLGARTRFGFDDVAARTDENGRSLPAWALYPAGVAAALRDRGLSVAGVDVALSSDVPMGAGLSSSAAIEVAFAVLWRSLGGWQIGGVDLARLCQQAENDYVGVACGLMDPFTSLHGQRAHALLLDCRSLEWRAVPLPPETVIVVADTKVRRQLAESEFNLRRRQCEAAVEILRRTMPTIRSLRDVAPAELVRRRTRCPPRCSRGRAT